MLFRSAPTVPTGIGGTGMVSMAMPTLAGGGGISMAGGPFLVSGIAAAAPVPTVPEKLTTSMKQAIADLNKFKETTVSEPAKPFELPGISLKDYYKGNIPKEVRNTLQVVSAQIPPGYSVYDYRVLEDNAGNKQISAIVRPSSLVDIGRDLSKGSALIKN